MCSKMRGNGDDVQCPPSTEVTAGTGAAQPGQEDDHGEGHVKRLRGLGGDSVDKRRGKIKNVVLLSVLPGA